MKKLIIISAMTIAVLGGMSSYVLAASCNCAPCDCQTQCDCAQCER